MLTICSFCVLRYIRFHAFTSSRLSSFVSTHSPLLCIYLKVYVYESNTLAYIYTVYMQNTDKKSSQNQPNNWERHSLRLNWSFYELFRVVRHDEQRGKYFGRVGIEGESQDREILEDEKRKLVQCVFLAYVYHYRTEIAVLLHPLYILLWALLFA